MKKLSILVLSAILLTMLVGCGPNASVDVNKSVSAINFNTPGPNPLANKPAENDQVAGIVQGLWHGFISPVTLVISFFNENVQMYEVHNIGKEYNLGFLLGAAIVFLVLGLSSGRRSRRR
ncbi:MAG: hypothetical protein ABI904_21600 [Chloroflexota bacterium]